jgi:hypothetical protein
MWMIMAEANRRTKNKDYQKSMLDWLVKRNLLYPLYIIEV